MRPRRLLAALAVATATLCAWVPFVWAAERPRREQVMDVTDAVFSAPELNYEERRLSLVEEWLLALREFMFELLEEHPVVFFVALGAVIVTLLVLLAHIVWTMRMAREPGAGAEEGGDIEAALRSLDPTPFRELALAEAQAGRYDEAVRHLYTALLLTLDARGAVRYARHKALLDYRLEARSDEVGTRVLRAFTDTYPPGSFGRRPPTPEQFETLVAALAELGESAAAHPNAAPPNAARGGERDGERTPRGSR